MVALTLAQATNSPILFTPPTADTPLSVVRVFGALLLVLAVFFAGVWLFKNWQRLQRHGGGSRARLQILEAKSLGNRQALYVVGYDQQRMLIAASPGHVALISALPDAAGTEPEQPAAPVFAAALQQVLNRKPS
jgi:flagellar biogenesis protein FliO